MGNKAQTRERILDVALELFNRNGSHAVTTNHIAEAAGLSVGNLYYHFKNKEEIVRALYEERLTVATGAAFVLPEDRPPTLADLEQLMRENFTILWRFRFFYREIMALLQRDPALAALYRSVRRRGYADFTGLFRHFADSGVFRPVGDDEIANLADICWMLSEFYLTFVEIGGEEPTETHLTHGVALLRQALRPYVVPAP